MAADMARSVTEGSIVLSSPALRTTGANHFFLVHGLQVRHTDQLETPARLGTVTVGVQGDLAHRFGPRPDCIESLPNCEFSAHCLATLALR